MLPLFVQSLDPKVFISLHQGYMFSTQGKFYSTFIATPEQVQKWPGKAMMLLCKKSHACHIYLV
jgi:hypothetical protein